MENSAVKGDYLDMINSQLQNQPYQKLPKKKFKQPTKQKMMRTMNTFGKKSIEARETNNGSHTASVSKRLHLPVIKSIRTPFNITDGPETPFIGSSHQVSMALSSRGKSMA